MEPKAICWSGGGEHPPHGIRYSSRPRTARVCVRGACGLPQGGRPRRGSAAAAGPVPRRGRSAAPVFRVRVRDANPDLLSAVL